MRVKVLLGVVLVLTITMLFPKSLTVSYEYPEGSIWNEDDLIAPFLFLIYRDAAIVEHEQDSARANTPLSFTRDDRIVEAVLDTVQSWSRVIIGALDSIAQKLPRNVPDELFRTRANEIARATSRNGPILNMDDWHYLLRQFKASGKFAENFSIMLKSAVSKLYAKGLLDQEKASFTLPRLALSYGNEEVLLPVKQFLDRTEIASFVQNELTADEALEKIVTKLVEQAAQPNILFDNGRTQIAIRAAVDKIPRTNGIVKENERIISRHERVTAETKAKLDSYQRVRMKRIGDENALLQFLGRAGHTIAILFLLGIYLRTFRKRIFNYNKKLSLVALIIAFQAVLAYLSMTIPISGSIQYLILVPSASMLLVIIFDSRVAFYSTVTISFLVGALRGNDYSIILASLLAGSMALYTVRDIKHRTQIFRSLMYIFIGYLFAISMDGIQRGIRIEEVAVSLSYAFINSILSPVITFGLLIFFEKVFGITTDLTLLELSDFNQPLLRELSTRAPGTFHHSIVMGSLAESAALAIDANPTLARVGAYYHDVGKMLHPEYFVENQLPGQNIHDSLRTEESVKRIIAHVPDGIELARMHKLPENVIEFIPSHHGKTVVEFFYRKAQKENVGEVRIEDFQYPGPKPYTKETGIVMLADTIEAATRAMDEPTKEKIEALIEGVVTKRLSDGELENCALTFRELTTVKKSFLSILTGIHHSRIKYPTAEEAEAARKIAERTAKLLNLPSTAEALSKRIKKIV